MLKAAEKIVHERIAAAEAEHNDGADPYPAFKQVLDEAASNPTLAGAIIFLYLGYALEAVNRHEAAPN